MIDAKLLAEFEFIEKDLIGNRNLHTILEILNCLVRKELTVLKQCNIIECVNVPNHSILLSHLVYLVQHQLVTYDPRFKAYGILPRGKRFWEWQKREKEDKTYEQTIVYKK